MLIWRTLQVAFSYLNHHLTLFSFSAHARHSLSDQCGMIESLLVGIFGFEVVMDWWWRVYLLRENELPCRGEIYCSTVSSDSLFVCIGQSSGDEAGVSVWIGLLAGKHHSMIFIKARQYLEYYCSERENNFQNASCWHQFVLAISCNTYAVRIAYGSSCSSIFYA